MSGLRLSVAGRRRQPGFHLCVLNWFVMAVFLLAASFTSLGQQNPVNSQSKAAAHADKGLRLAQAGDLAAAESEMRTSVSLAPANPEFLTNLATVLAMEKKLEDSTMFFQRGLKIDPANLTARRYLAANLWQLRRYSEARFHLEQILAQQSDDRQSRLLLGMVLENMKDYAAAVKMLSSVPDEVRKQPEAIAALADSFYHLREKEKARSTLEELENISVGSRLVLLGAQVADENADYDYAERLITSLKSGDADDPGDFRYRLAVVQFHARKFEQSEEILAELIASGTKTSRVFNLLGWCYEKQGQTEPAMHAFENGIGVDPTDESNYLDLQNVLIANKKIAAALEVAKKTTSALPGSPRAFALKGSIEVQASQFNDAVESYHRARQLDPASADAALGVADAEFAADRKGEANTDYEAGIKRFPKDARFPLHYADVLLKDAESGDPTSETRAHVLLKNAVKLDPSSVEAHCELGDLALKQGNASEALVQFTAATKIDRENPHAHFGLSKAYRRLGRTEEASQETKLFQQLQDAKSNPASAQPSGASAPN
jgi:tetratricopeptide (TPR) repeat protein